MAQFPRERILALLLAVSREADAETDATPRVTRTAAWRDPVPRRLILAVASLEAPFNTLGTRSWSWYPQ